MNKRLYFACILAIFFPLAGQTAEPQDVDLAQEAFSSFWTLDANTTATLELASNAGESRTVAVTLLVGGTSPVELPRIQLSPGETRRLPLELYLPRLPGKARSWGTARIAGENLTAIYGWITSESRHQGLSVNSLFQGSHEAGGNLFGVWWRATRSAQTLVTVQNTSRTVLRVDPVITAGQESVPGEPIELLPHQGKLFTLEELVAPRHRRLLERHDAGSLRLKTGSGERALVGLLVQTDPTSRFSLPLHMQDLSRRGSTVLHTAGFPLGWALPIPHKGIERRFEPKILLANTADAERQVHIELLEENPVTSDAEATTEEELNLGRTFTLPPVVLAAGATLVLDLVEALESQGIHDVNGLVAAELRHSGRPGDLFAEAVSISQDLALAFHDPILDASRPTTFQTSVSFDLSEGRNKVLTLKNFGSEPVLANYVLYYLADGENRIHHGVRFLPAKSLSALDLRQLRDSQDLDIYDNALPADLTFGHVAVSSEKATVLAGDFAFDEHRSYATCMDGCDGCSPELPGCFASVASPSNAVEICPDEPTPTVTLIFGFFFVGQGRSSCQYELCPGQDSALCPPSPFRGSLRPGDGVCRPYLKEVWSYPDCGPPNFFQTFSKPSGCP